MPCIEDLNYEVLLGNSSYQECVDYIAANCNEVHYVLPGYKLFDLHLLGVPPIPLGADGEKIILPYLKPCRGSFVLKIKGETELQFLRTAKKKVIRFNGTDFVVICWDGHICEKCPKKKVFFEGFRLAQCLRKPEVSLKLIQTAVRFLEKFSNHRRV